METTIGRIFDDTGPGADDIEMRRLGQHFG
jgi:hypothetical protein